MGGKWDLHRLWYGHTWELLVRHKTIHVLLKNDREKQVILQIINFFYFFLVFSIKIHNFAKEQTFNSNNYGEFQ